ncbi:MAG: hypothetical protein ACP5JH_01140 [Bacteroidota bacterium]
MDLKRKLSAVAIYAIAMGYLEAAVVVYLRNLYYPDVFTFPLKLLPLKIVIVELAREASTLVMLGAVGYLAGSRRFVHWLSYFAFAFGVWDIFYYVFLKITMSWPVSLLDWDILFLIPLPWAGPVITPILVSVGLIGGSILILWREEIGKPIKLAGLQWALLVCGALIIIFSFLWNAPALVRQMSPRTFPWAIFIFGYALAGIAFLSAFRSQASIKV